MAENERLMNILMLEQESKRLEEQLNSINQQVIELISLQGSMNDFKETKEKEILSHFGKGIFFKSEITDKDFLVNIGAGIVVKKSHDEAIEIINRQVLQIEKLKESLIAQIETINAKLVELVEEYQRGKG
ncbi:prefoldin subunit alpha [archaeon]|nr:prefoldin subunit alpha [archaeon]